MEQKKSLESIFQFIPTLLSNTVILNQIHTVVSVELNHSGKIHILALFQTLQ